MINGNMHPGFSRGLYPNSKERINENEDHIRRGSKWQRIGKDGQKHDNTQTNKNKQKNNGGGGNGLH